MIRRCNRIVLFIIVYFISASCAYVCRSLSFEYFRTDKKHLKELNCLVAHVDIGEACQSREWEKVIKYAKTLVSKRALDQYPMYCLAEAYKKLNRGQEALKTYL